MLSSVDFLSFAVWVDGQPVRALSLDPDNGYEALRALFGFILEGTPRDDDIDPFEVPLFAFHAL